MALPTYGPGGVPRKTEFKDYTARGSGYGGGGRVVYAQQPKIIYAQPTTSADGLNAETLAAIQKAKAYYAPGGGFGKGVEAGLERGRVKAVSAGMQNLVSAGLAGTTMAGGLGKRYEEEVAAPTRAGVEEQRARAISGIEMAQAGMGFQAGQTSAQRSLQRYITELQAQLSREQMGVQMAMANRPSVSMAAPYQPTRQAQQFPSLYGETGGSVPAVPPASSLGGGQGDVGIRTTAGVGYEGAYAGNIGQPIYGEYPEQKKPSARTQASYVGPGYWD